MNLQRPHSAASGPPPRAIRRDDDTIKVIIRFKGNEQLDRQESDSWRCNQGNEITTPPDRHS